MNSDLLHDFNKSNGIVFHEFYDSFFELIDNSLKERELEAYVENLKKILFLMMNKTTLFSAKKRPSMTPDPRPSYTPWMLQNYPVHPPTPTVLYPRPSSRYMASFKADFNGSFRSTIYT